MGNQYNPVVSVIVPVFNDSERLKTCLQALENQTYLKELYEVIVVDNSSDESIEGVVNQFAQAVTTCESYPGSYAARNRGISVAKGEILAFTDADCIPALNWIEKGVAHLMRAPNCGLVAGKIELFFKNPNEPTVVEYYDSIMMLGGLKQQKFVEKSRYGATANLFTLKRVIDKVGYFDQSLKSSGDREWGQRIFSAGYKQIYADDTRVYHPARQSLEQLHKKVVRIVGGHQDLNKRKEYSFGNFIKDTSRDLKPPFRVFLHILLDNNLKTLDKKFHFIFLLFYLKYLAAWERTRIQLGGISKRD